GASLALGERAGDLPGRVHAILDIHRQREEVDVALVAGRGRGEDHGVALADDDGAGRLLGELAGLERDLAAADLDGDGRCAVSTAHSVVLPCPPFGRWARLLASLRYPNGLRILGVEIDLAPVQEHGRR